MIILHRVLRKLSFENLLEAFLEVGLSEPNLFNTPCIGRTVNIKGANLISGQNLNPVISSSSTDALLFANSVKQLSADEFAKFTDGQQPDLTGFVLSNDRNPKLLETKNDPALVIIQTTSAFDLSIVVECSDLLITDLVVNDSYYFKIFKNEETEEFYQSEVIDTTDKIKIFKPVALEQVSAQDTLTFTVMEQDTGLDDLIGHFTCSVHDIPRRKARGTLKRQRTGFSSCMPSQVGQQKTGTIRINVYDPSRKYSISANKTKAAALDQISTAGITLKDVEITKGGYNPDVYGNIKSTLKNQFLNFTKTKDLVVTDSCLFSINEETQEIGDVVIYDNNLQNKQGTREKIKRVVHVTHTDSYHLTNLDRKFEFRVKDKEVNKQNRRKAKQVIKNNVLAKIEKQPNGSFAKVHDNSLCRWFIQGRDYFWYLSHMLDNAKSEIYITDWWFTPEIMLRRPAAKYTKNMESKSWELFDILHRKANGGGPGKKLRKIIFGSKLAHKINQSG